MEGAINHRPEQLDKAAVIKSYFEVGLVMVDTSGFRTAVSPVLGTHQSIFR